MHRARSVREYVDWVRQALFEIDDLRECLLYESETLARFPQFIETLETGLKNLYRAMEQGTYQFGREDLAFMDIARRHNDEIPFFSLLESLNETHRRGLDTQESS